MEGEGEGEGEKGEAVIENGGWERKAVTNYCRLRGGKGVGKWWEKKVGRWRRGYTGSYCIPVYESQADEGRRELVGGCVGIIGAPALKRWVRMEDTGCGDEMGRGGQGRSASD